MAEAISVYVEFCGVDADRHFSDIVSIYPPLPSEGDQEPLTLRQLISLATVEQLKRRHASTPPQPVRWLTQSQIEQAAACGKIQPCRSHRRGKASPAEAIDRDQAVADAVQACADRLYLVLVDGVHYQNLDAEVILGPRSRVIFVQTTMFSGA